MAAKEFIMSTDMEDMVEALKHRLMDLEARSYVEFERITPLPDSSTTSNIVIKVNEIINILNVKLRTNRV